jgi:hypothetical protein
MGFSEDCSLFLAENFYSLRGSPYITVTGLVEKCKRLIEKKEISMNVVFLLFLTLKKRNISIDEIDIKSCRELLFGTQKSEVIRFFRNKMKSDFYTKEQKRHSLKYSDIEIECMFHLQNLNPPEFVEPNYIIDNQANFIVNFISMKIFSNRKNPDQAFFFDYVNQFSLFYN